MWDNLYLSARVRGRPRERSRSGKGGAVEPMAEAKVYLPSGRQLVLGEYATCEGLFDPIAKILRCPCQQLQLIVGELSIEYACPPVTQTVLKENEVVTVVQLHGPYLEEQLSGSELEDSEEPEAASPGELAEEGWAMELSSQTSEGSDGSSIWVPPAPSCMH